MDDSLGDRMKKYEGVFTTHLVPRLPAILRIDGRAFHSYTSKLRYPYDGYFSQGMQNVGQALLKDISTAKFAYGQSDEISVLLIDTTNLNTQQWFGGNVQKIVSTAASTATAVLNQHMSGHTNKLAQFDARIFSIPESDVPNYFYWRYKDCVRNSVSMAAYAQFSHKELHGMSCEEMKVKLRLNNTPWEDMPRIFKNGWLYSSEGYMLEFDDIRTPFGDNND